MITGITSASITNTLSGLLPERSSSIFETMLRRARTLIKDVPAEVLEKECDNLHTMCISVAPHLYGASDEEDSINDNDQELVASLLYKYREAFDVESNEFKLNWPQYFGLYALWCIEQARFQEEFIGELEESVVRTLTDKRSTLKELRDNLSWNTCSRNLSEATEAVIHGESLSTHQLSIDEEITREIQDRATKAAEAKHQPSYKLIRFVQEYYLRNRHLSSKAEVIRKAYRKAPKELQIYISEEHAVRNLTKHLKDIKPI